MIYSLFIKTFNTKMSKRNRIVDLVNKTNREYLPKNNYFIRDYQENAVDAITEYFKNNNKGILEMPHQSGKTFVSYIFSLNYKNTIILSPSFQSTQTIFYKYRKYDPDIYGKIIDKKLKTEVPELIEFINNTDRRVFFISYKNIHFLDILFEKINDDSIIIIDDYHALQDFDVLEKDNNVSKLLSTNKKILFMSATPNYSSELFGNQIFSIKQDEMKNRGMICDFKIYLPINSKNTNVMDKMRFIESGLSLMQCKKIIIFFDFIDEISFFKNYCQDSKNLNKYQIHKIVGTDSFYKRSNVLKIFSTKDVRSILCTTHRMYSSIDYGDFDSVFIMSSVKIKNRLSKEISLCIQKNEYKQYGNCFFWYDNFENLCDLVETANKLTDNLQSKIKLIQNKRKEKKIFIKDLDITLDEFLKKDTVDDLISFKYWDHKLEELKKFYDTNKRKPSQSEKKLYSWMSKQIYDYTNNIMNQYKMEKWTQFNKDYNHVFVSKKELWLIKYNDLINFLNINKKIPTEQTDSDNEIVLCRWYKLQMSWYVNKKGIMKDNDYKNNWEKLIFADKYVDIIYNTNWKIEWQSFYDAVIKHVIENKAKPVSNHFINGMKYGHWHDFTSKLFSRSIIKDKDILKKWKKLKQIYSECNSIKNPLPTDILIFDDDKSIWNLNYVKFKNFIEKYKSIPSFSIKTKDERKMRCWYYKTTKKIETDFDKYAEKYPQRIYLLNKLKEEYPDVIQINFKK